MSLHVFLGHGITVLEVSTALCTLLGVDSRIAIYHAFIFFTHFVF
jgi:hypothetical protein